MPGPCIVPTAIRGLFALMVLLATACLDSAPAGARVFTEFGSAAEARATAESAARLIRRVGLPGAINTFIETGNGFAGKDLYVFIIDLDGGIWFHYNHEIIGLNGLDMQDLAGKRFIAEITARARDENGFWTSYLIPHPFTGEVMRKRVWAVRVDDVIVMCGAYVPVIEL